MTKCEEPLFFRLYRDDRYTWIPLKIAVRVDTAVCLYNHEYGFLALTPVSLVENGEYYRNVLYEDNTIEFPKPKRKGT